MRARYFGKYYVCRLQGEWARDMSESPSLELANTRTYAGGKYNAKISGITFKRRIKSHLPFAGIIKSSPYSPRFEDNG